MATLYESYDGKRKSIISMINQQHQNSIVTFVKTETAHFLDRPSEQNKVQRQPLKNNGEFIIFYQKIANHFSWFAILDGFYSILDRFCPLNYCRSLFCEITFFVSYCIAPEILKCQSVFAQCARHQFILPLISSVYMYIDTKKVISQNNDRQ